MRPETRPGRIASARLSLLTTFHNARERGLRVAHQLDARTGGWLSVIASAIRNYANMNSSEGAAGMTFYAVFSLFPLLALVVTISSLLVAENQMEALLHRFLTPLFPFSAELIDQNIIRFARQRGAVGILGILGLLWSASNVFVILVHNINMAWRGTRVRNFLQRRLIALSLIVVIIILLAGSLMTTTVVSILGNLQPVWITQLPFLTNLAEALTPVLRFGITSLVFLFIYRYIPATPVRFGDAIWGAMLVAAMWQLTTQGLSLYLGSGFSRYDVVYGSIAAIVILMVWMYLNNMMILFGAHLTAAVWHRRNQHHDNPVITVRQDGR